MEPRETHTGRIRTGILRKKIASSPHGQAARHLKKKALEHLPASGGIPKPFYIHPPPQQGKRGYPTPENAILHPILHPKSPINTGRLGHGCRKCRIFFQNFFRGERRDIGPGVKEGGLPS